MTPDDHHDVTLCLLFRFIWYLPTNFQHNQTPLCMLFKKFHDIMMTAHKFYKIKHYMAALAIRPVL